MNYKIVLLRENKNMVDECASWFNEKWGIPKQAYLDSMNDCIKGEGAVPQWYVALDGDKIVGGMGVIENDFHNRPDLSPNVCAVYVEEDYRNQGIAGALLEFVCDDMADYGIEVLYLVTNHIGYYERYGWEYLCNVKCDGDEISRMYIHRMK